jgi:predicted TIM-barrel fold metal-dependent hydrolase
VISAATLGLAPPLSACVGCLGASAGALQTPLPALDDVEGAAVPAGLPPIVDAHCHLFPDRLFEAIWRWFDEHGWPIRYRLHAEQVVAFQRARGVSHLVGLHYAHLPGMARQLNTWMAEFQASHPGVTGVATVFPGEDGAGAILADGFRAGLRGVKLHCHVQCFAPDDDALAPVYAACCDHDQPLVMHAGREPKSPAYGCDPHALCSAERVERVLRAYPGLKLIVPHLGADESDGYARLLDRYDHLWLDTTMVIADYFPFDAPTHLVALRPDRILFGTDFPNLPYAWDRELVRLASWGLPEPALRAILGGNARELFQIPATG